MDLLGGLLSNRGLAAHLQGDLAAARAGLERVITLHEGRAERHTVPRLPSEAETHEHQVRPAPGRGRRARARQLLQYLCATFSLKQSAPEGFTPRQCALVEGWRRAILTIAAQEMLHLASVNNPSAIGPRPKCAAQLARAGTLLLR